jgi:hypothetical protein
LDDATLKEYSNQALREYASAIRDHPDIAGTYRRNCERFGRELDARRLKPKPRRSYAWMGWTAYIGVWVAMLTFIFWKATQ